MVNTYRTVPVLVSQMPATAGAIVPQVDRDYAISMADAMGGYNGTRATAGMVGGGAVSDFKALNSAMIAGLAGPFPPVVFSLTGHFTQTLNVMSTLFGSGPAFPGVGSQAGSRWNFGIPGSGTLIWAPVGGMIVKDMTVVGGSVIFDFSISITTEVPLIVLEGLYCDNISVLLRDGSIANGLTRKLDKLLFKRNWLHNNDRGLFFNGNGASRAWVSDNHVDACDRFGILIGPAVPLPQRNGFSDFMMYRNNFVERLNFGSGSANANPFIMFGRYGNILGNIVANSAYNGIADQSNFEPYYTKAGVCAILGNVTIDGGANQGMYALKGGARINTDNSCGGWDYILCGNVGSRTASYAFQTPNIWIQCTDANMGCNVFETQFSASAHFNKGVNDDPESHVTNNMLHDNIFLRSGGAAVASEGCHRNTWVNGNMIQGIGGSGTGFGVRFDSLITGTTVDPTVRNFRFQGNTFWNFLPTAASRTDSIHIKTSKPGDSFYGSLPITDNVIDVATAPDQSQTYGIRFEGTGDIQGCLVDGNHYIGFSSANRVINNITGGGNRSGKTLTILDNPGIANDNTGTGTIAVGASSVVISHGLPQFGAITSTPDVSDITIAPTSVLLGATQMRISATAATTFTVTLDANVATSDFTFAWRVRKTAWTFN